QWGQRTKLKNMRSCLLKYIEIEDVLLKKINYDFLVSFEAYLKAGNVSKSQKPLKPHTISTHLRMIVTLYNHAIDSEKFDILFEDFPFSSGGRRDKNKFRIKVPKASKRALDRSIIKDLVNLSLEDDSSVWHVRNFFLFQYYCRGMGPGDLAFLKIKNLEGRDRKVLHYRRSKVSHHENVKDLVITLPLKAKEIADYYIADKSDPECFIFPLLKDEYNSLSSEELFKKRNYAVQQYNVKLKALGKLIGEPRISSYFARHSFATHALKEGIHLFQISQMLGHTNIDTTRVYLSDFNHVELDQSADKVFDF
ncbi:MAG: tyrosine-type recombinase/integrase, partial [Cyclobacteriaceae bacterium]